MCEIDENTIPQNFNWRAGIGTNQKPTIVQMPGDDYIEEPPLPPDPMGVRAVFLRSIDNKPPKVELPPIRKSKQAQYWDAVLHNGVIWKTGDDDTRPETDADLKAQQTPIPINEPVETIDIPNNFTISYTAQFIPNCTINELPINGLPNIKM